MGLINRFLDEHFYKKYNFVNFIETGTGLGYSLSHATRFGFNNFMTVDIDPEAIIRTERNVKDSRIKFFTGKSVEMIPEMCHNKGVTLFWLDAHFPCSYTGADFDKEDDTTTRLPLELELITIKNSKSQIENDVIIIDDLRIYEDGPFEDGNWDRRKELGGEGIDFIVELYKSTHSIHKDFRDQGYIVLLPKG